MTVDTTRARLAALQAQITGVVTAYPNVPRAVQEVELPAFMTLVGRATYSKQMLGELALVETRIYTQRLIIKTATLGIEGEAEDETTVFFDRVLDFFADRPQLQLDATSSVVYSAQITSDSGVIILPYPSAGNTVKYFAAIDFPTEVVEIRSI
jgi:hypothetical protein